MTVERGLVVQERESVKEPSDLFSPIAQKVRFE